jgi:DNA invertase Pin-like site-specific DNA recombinase
MRVALYARVSTLNNQDPEMQLREMRECAARRTVLPNRTSKVSVSGWPYRRELL